MQERHNNVIVGMMAAPGAGAAPLETAAPRRQRLALRARASDAVAERGRVQRRTGLGRVDALRAVPPAQPRAERGADAHEQRHDGEGGSDERQVCRQEDDGEGGDAQHDLHAVRHERHARRSGALLGHMLVTASSCALCFSRKGGVWERAFALCIGHRRAPGGSGKQCGLGICPHASHCQS